jgi:hypothetical protein
VGDKKLTHSESNRVGCRGRTMLNVGERYLTAVLLMC